MVMLCHAGGEEEGSGSEVRHVAEAVGDAFEDAEAVVGGGAFDAAVGYAVGVVEGEDLVSPLEQRLFEPVELDQGRLLPDVEEGSERLVGPQNSRRGGCRRGVGASAMLLPARVGPPALCRGLGCGRL